MSLLTTRLRNEKSLESEWLKEKRKEPIAKGPQPTRAVPGGICPGGRECIGGVGGKVTGGMRQYGTVTFDV